MPKQPGLMGVRVKVVVKAAKKHCLIAEVVNKPNINNEKLLRVNSIHSIWPVFALLICVLARLIWLLV